MSKLLTIIFTVALAFSVNAKGKSTSNTINLTIDNTVTLNGPVNDKSVQGIQLKAKKLDATLKSGYPIYLVLNTPGGSIQAGLELIEFLRSLNRPVHTITIFAASMGWQISQHLGNRYILNYGVLMSHKASGGFSGEFPGQLDNRRNFWGRRLYQMDIVTVKRTRGKQTMKSYLAAYENELWVGGTDAVKLGYSDKVVKMNCSKELAQSRENITIMSFFGEFKLEFSGCPTVTGPTAVTAMLRTNQGMISLQDFNKKGGIYPSEVEGNNYAEIKALDPKVDQKTILDLLKKYRYKFLNRNAIIRSY
jgi:ATP-dependent Clp protease protease subunit